MLISFPATPAIILTCNAQVLLYKFKPDCLRSQLLPLSLPLSFPPFLSFCFLHTLIQSILPIFEAEGHSLRYSHLEIVYQTPYSGSR